LQVQIPIGVFLCREVDDIDRDDVEQSWAVPLDIPSVSLTLWTRPPTAPVQFKTCRLHPKIPHQKQTLKPRALIKTKDARSLQMTLVIVIVDLGNNCVEVSSRVVSLARKWVFIHTQSKIVGEYSSIYSGNR